MQSSSNYKAKVKAKQEFMALQNKLYVAINKLMDNKKKDGYVGKKQHDLDFITTLKLIKTQLDYQEKENSEKEIMNFLNPADKKTALKIKKSITKILEKQYEKELPHNDIKELASHIKFTGKLSVTNTLVSGKLNGIEDNELTKKITENFFEIQKKIATNTDDSFVINFDVLETAIEKVLSANSSYTLLEAAKALKEAQDALLRSFLTDKPKQTAAEDPLSPPEASLAMSDDYNKLTTLQSLEINLPILKKQVIEAIKKLETMSKNPLNDISLSELSELKNNLKGSKEINPDEIKKALITIKSIARKSDKEPGEEDPLATAARALENLLAATQTASVKKDNKLDSVGKEKKNPIPPIYKKSSDKKSLLSKKHTKKDDSLIFREEDFPISDKEEYSIEDSSSSRVSSSTSEEEDSDDEIKKLNLANLDKLEKYARWLVADTMRIICSVNVAQGSSKVNHLIKKLEKYSEIFIEQNDLKKYGDIIETIELVKEANESIICYAHAAYFSDYAENTDLNNIENVITTLNNHKSLNLAPRTNAGLATKDFFSTTEKNFMFRVTKNTFENQNDPTGDNLNFFAVQSPNKIEFRFPKEHLAALSDGSLMLLAMRQVEDVRCLASPESNETLSSFDIPIYILPKTDARLAGAIISYCEKMQYTCSYDKDELIPTRFNLSSLNKGKATDNNKFGPFENKNSPTHPLEKSRSEIQSDKKSAKTQLKNATSIRNKR